MRFEQACREMLNCGKRIRRHGWATNHYWYLTSGEIVTPDGGCAVIKGFHLLADDWEVYGEAAPAVVSVEGQISMLTARVKALEESWPFKGEFEYGGEQHLARDWFERFIKESVGKSENDRISALERLFKGLFKAVEPGQCGAK